LPKKEENLIDAFVANRLQRPFNTQGVAKETAEFIARLTYVTPGGTGYLVR
jgi:hypothetical protein